MCRRRSSVDDAFVRNDQKIITTEATMKNLSLTLSLVAVVLLFPLCAEAGAVKDFTRAGVLIGADDDNQDNPLVQPADSAINQSLDNADVVEGFDGPDVLIGLLGADLLDGGSGDDILIGGPEAFVAPNKDIILGGTGDDVNIWAPGDGSDAFMGGDGSRDAHVFGVLDRVDGVPTLTPSNARRRTGIPTAEVTNQPGFCVLEKVSRQETGFDYLVRFFTFSDGLLKVTIRLRDVEQLFCTSPDGGAITYANLAAPNPPLDVVTIDQVRAVNPLVGQIIR